MSHQVLEMCPSLPISGKHGSRKLEVLRRRLEYLKTRIAEAPVEKDMHYDKAEFSAIDWTINHVIELETDLAKLEKKFGA